MVGTWTRASVVVDVANLTHAIAVARDAVGGGGRQARLVPPDLGRVRDVLGHLGVEVVGFHVALPVEPIEVLGVAGRPSARTGTVDASRAWLARQQAALGPELVHALHGATDGNGELGVDALCVLEAIATSWDPAVHLVVVMSGDADLMVAQDYVTDTPILAAGRFGSRERTLLRSEGRGWIDLRDAALARMVPGDAPPLPMVHLDAGEEPQARVVGEARLSGDADAAIGRRLSWMENGQRVVLSSDLDAVPDPSRHQRRVEATAGARTVAVTDPHELSLATGRAIGVAKLPTPATVEEVLATLGMDMPLAQFAAVPDIVDRLLAGADLGDLHRRALEQLDDELETLIRAHEQDGDVRTLVSVGRLAAERDGAIDPQLRRIEEKKVLTTLAADVLWALRHTDLPVAVVSDRAELAYLLTMLDGYVPDAEQRLVRVGLHGQPFRRVEEPGRAEGVGSRLDEGTLAGLRALQAGLPPADRTAQVVVLNGPCAAQLVGLTRQLHGPALLAAIHQEIADTSVEWRMVRFDAATLGAVLSPVERPEVEAVFHRMLEVDGEVARRLAEGGVVPAGVLGVALRRNDERPCELPTLHTGGDEVAVHDLAVLIEHRDGSLHLDIDGDRRPDLAVTVSHGAEAYLPGHTVVYRRIGERIEVLGPLDPQDPGQHPMVVVANGDGTVTDPDTQRTAALLELPDVQDVARPVGSRLLAYPYADGSFQALSTTLGYLA